MQLREGPSGLRMASLTTRVCLPSFYDDIDILWLKLKSEAAPANAFGRNHGGATSQKAIENEGAALGAIQNGLSNEPHRLNRGV